MILEQHNASTLEQHELSKFQCYNLCFSGNFPLCSFYQKQMVICNLNTE